MNITVELQERSYDVVVEEGARDRSRRTRRATGAAGKVCRRGDLDRHSPRSPGSIYSTGVEQFVVLVPDGESAKTIGAFGATAELVGRASPLARRRGRGGRRWGRHRPRGFRGARATCAVSHWSRCPPHWWDKLTPRSAARPASTFPPARTWWVRSTNPWACSVIRASCLRLPDRERRNGLGEVAKCWLLEGRDVDRRRDRALESISLNCRCDSRRPSWRVDEREGDSRVLLNYGHTLAHALEAVALAENPDELRHGEAVAVGLAFAARLARTLGRVGDDVVDTHDAVLDAFGLDRRLKRVRRRRRRCSMLMTSRQEGPTRSEFRLRRYRGATS